ncbi:DNA-sulfur modification-associated [Actinopolyspora lacussalsi subsp. righensis]|uniref:DNA-sulfur modification-associated n=1 Tax=Actinopolyspora righensis TaxID=995060 RepID=A0A1I7CD73_9ACTN|nr:DNA sulfur modification protein DndB [Actinopolyspora righensis]SFT97375.1 DNA-sulfur modification-associated [Actinopolyspora righensis]
MSIPMPTSETEGIRLHVTPFRPEAVIGALGLPTLLQLVPSPKSQENQQALKHASGTLRRHAEVRGLVQRMLRSTSKGRNVASYAGYMAAGVKGDLGAAWSTPPVTLWLGSQLASIGEELVAGTGMRTVSIAPGSPVVAIDGETQVAAWHELYDSPERYGLTIDALTRIRVPFELFWGLDVKEARQIFYDRNVEGITVAKNLAMSMDQRDFGTRLAHLVIDAVRIERDGESVPFGKFVETRGRQLKASSPEVVTLSALRVLVVCTLFGRAGLTRSGSTLRDEELPEGVTAEQATRRLVPLLSTVISTLREHFLARSAVSAPAVLAGIGIAAHQATGWATTGGTLTEDELLQLLSTVRWEREASYWHGVAASANAKGTLNFAGGAKDAGGRVADAIVHPESQYGRRIRGR